MMEMVQCNQPATNHWLATPGTGAISETQCRCLLLTYWALSSGCSQVGLGEWKATLLGSGVTSIPDTMVALFMSPLANDRLAE